MHLGVDAVEYMDYLVNVEKKAPREAARAWMQQNGRIVESWFAP
jgi:ABC-type proline/glycine betaine transport system substrate-binding protein